jgi:hypothetical protein
MEIAFTLSSKAILFANVVTFTTSLVLADKAGTYMGGAPHRIQLYWLALSHTNNNKIC